MTDIINRVRTFLRNSGLPFTIDKAEEFESIIRDIVREEIRFADAAERERRQTMLADIRAGRPVDAFVNYGNEEPTK
jgi:TPP-dependent pyruvate/acetoin dehydrogenase alpha subunit